MKMIKKNAFTLIELLAVLVVLVIILAIAIPSITGIINNARKNAFTSDIKIVIKTIERKIALEDDFDVYNLTVDNMKNLIDISSDNYEAIYVLDSTYEPPVLGSNYPSLMTRENTVSAPKWMSSSNDSSLAVTIPEGKVYVYIIGKNKWAGLVGQGTLKSVSVVESDAGCHEASNNYEIYQRTIALSSGGYLGVGFISPFDDFATDGLISKHNEDGSHVWSKTFAGSEDEMLNDVVETSDGYIVVGSTMSSDGDIDGTNQGYQDALIIKYDSNGSIVWQKLFGGSNTDEYYSVLTVADGYVALGASYSSNGDLTGINNGHSDGIIVKYDNNGNVVWKKSYGDANHQSFIKAINLSDGYLVVGDTGDTGDGNGNALIAKFDLSGNIIWDTTTGGTESDYFNDVAKVLDGYIAVGATYSSDGDITGLSKGSSDALLVKYDLNGNRVLIKTFGGTESDYYTDIITTSDGYVLSGNSSSHDLDMISNDGIETGFVSKYDLSNNMIWQDIIGSDYENSYLYSITVDDEYYISSGVAGNDIDAFIRKYDSNGNIIWNQLNNVKKTVCPQYNYCGLESYIPYESDYTTIEADGSNYLIAGQYSGVSFITKYGANGKIIWEKQIPNVDWSDSYAQILIHDIESTANGYMAVGIDQDVNQAYLSKYDKNGNMLWSKVNDNDASYVVIKEFGTGYLAIVKDYTNNYIFLQKLDGNGNVIWTANDGSLLASNITKDIEVLADGYITIGGIYGATVTATITKYDLLGNLVWTKSYNTGTENFFNGVTVDDTGYVVAGLKDSSTLLVKYDTNGNIVFEKSNSINSINDVEAVSDGYILSGGALLKFDKNGNFVWEKFTEYENPFLETIGIGSQYYAISGDPRNRSYYTIIDGAMHLTYFLRYAEINIYGETGNLISVNAYKGNEFYLSCSGGLPQ